MRTFRVLPFVAPLLLLPSWACESSGSSSGGGAPFDPDGGGGFEAAPPPEGGPPPVLDGGTDALPDVTPKGVSVSVVDGAAPVKDIRVIAHDATGAVIGDVKTDATGRASFATAPAMITVLERPFGSAAALTYLGVAEGDVLVVNRPQLGSEETSIGKYSITANPNGILADSIEYQVGGDACVNNNSPVTAATEVTLYPMCLGATGTILATARDGGVPLGFGFQKNVAKPALNTTANIGPITLAPKGNATLKATNVPAGSFIDSVDFRPVVGDRSFYVNGATGTIDDAAGAVYPIPTGFADAYESRVIVRKGETSPSQTVAFVRREASNGTNAQALAYDFAQALPFVTNAVVSGPVPARSDVTITSSAPTATSDGGYVLLGWTIASGAVTSHQWSFVVPPGTTTFKIPALPADATEYLPSGTVSVSDVVFVESTLLSGFSQLKTLPTPASGVPLMLNLYGSNAALPANGTIRVSSWGGFVGGND